MKPHGNPRPYTDDPDPGFDEAVAAARKLKRRIRRGYVLLLLHCEEGVTVGHEVGGGHGVVRDTARFMSERPARRR